ncbi:putative integral membrane protein conserved region (DUF2404) [Raphanus sativus]|uniref:Uncharacterized protein LOC108806775 n=1 Tax=Raphanus sativus TaxID=3726 RepID=A0A6J0JHI8_RAPSA|nr:uncharacterized protein LOC108806775 [Raphanus sativus]KAJ4889434.1 putative integral membrane protein conserved region (DUF2404) [Raphanus sativus]
MFSSVGFVFLSGVFLGIIVILAAEAAGLMYLVNRLNRRKDPKHVSDPSTNDPPIDFSLNKQGMVWILEVDEGVKNWLKEKPQKEHKRKRDFLEVHPLRKFARIKDHKLLLSDASADSTTQTTVSLKCCSIDAVSGSHLPTRKWAKRFPIKVESKISSELYKGNKVFYIYLETSWEKESWCKALRLAACDNPERFIWYSTKLQQDFRSYVTSLNVAYHSFMKPSAGFCFETFDKGNKTDGGSSKVRLFLKRFSRKRSHREDRKNSVRSYQDSQHGSSSGRSGSGRRMGDYSADESDLPVFSRSVSHSSHVSGVSDGDSEEKFDMDEGTLAWNLLISRLFFDLKQKTGVKSSVQARIQRVLSSMRTPSYIGELICSDVDTGNLPPHIHGTRVLPMEMSGVWAFELDIEYFGEAVIEVETRVDIREVDLQKGITDTRLQPSSAGEEVEDFEKQLVQNGGSNKTDESKGSKGTKTSPNGVSRWKSIIKNIAEQVSQVPISLSIRVSSLRGTLRVHLKQPPSDQLWFGFTSMPDVEFDLASSVGEHKITNSHVAMFLINRFKAAIREAVVLPNCESLTIPWMIAEKDDWVQRNAAPFMWMNQESDHSSSHATEGKSKSDKPPTCSSSVHSEQMQKTADTTQKPIIPEAVTLTSSSCAQSEQVHGASNTIQAPNFEAEATFTPLSRSSTTVTVKSEKSLEELKTPLLRPSSSEKQYTNSRDRTTQSPSRTILLSSEEDDSSGKKLGRRARMLGLGKKMGEKLEEKRRHMEEKSRQIVEKMRGPS